MLAKKQALFPAQQKMCHRVQNLYALCIACFIRWGVLHGIPQFEFVQPKTKNITIICICIGKITETYSVLAKC